MIRFDFHATYAKATIRAHVTGGTGFISASLGDTNACLYLSVEQTRAMVASLQAGLAEHDLVADAKARAAAEREAA